MLARRQRDAITLQPDRAAEADRIQLGQERRERVIPFVERSDQRVPVRTGEIGTVQRDREQPRAAASQRRARIDAGCGAQFVAQIEADPELAIVDRGQHAQRVVGGLQPERVVRIQRDLDAGRRRERQQPLQRGAQRGIAGRIARRHAVPVDREPQHARPTGQRAQRLLDRLQARGELFGRRVGGRQRQHRVGAEHVDIEPFAGKAQRRQLGELAADPVEAEFVRERGLALHIGAAHGRVHHHERPRAAVRSPPRLQRPAGHAQPAAVVGRDLDHLVTDRRHHAAVRPGLQLRRNARRRQCRWRRLVVDERLHHARIADHHRPPQATDQRALRQPRIRRRRHERHRVLPRQRIVLGRELEAVPRHLEQHLRLAHRVLGLDRHLRVLGAELDQHHTATRPQRLSHLLHHAHRVRQLVVDVDHQHQIARRRRQTRIVDRRFDADDVVEIGGIGALPQHHQVLRLQLDRVDRATGTHFARQRQRVIAVATTEVGDAMPGRHREPAPQRGAVLLGLAGGAQQPRGTGPVHRLGDLATEELRAPRRRRLRILRRREADRQPARQRGADPGAEAPTELA